MSCFSVRKHDKASSQIAPPTPLPLAADSPAGAMKDAYSRTVGGADPLQALQKVLETQPQRALSSHEFERLQQLSRRSVVLGSRHKVDGLSTTENEKLRTVTLTLADLLKIMAVGPVSLCGSGVHYLRNADVAYSDFDFKIDTQAGWKKLRTTVQLQFATTIFRAAQIDTAPTAELAAAVFETFAFEAREVGDLFKIRFNHRRMAADQALDILPPLDFTLKPRRSDMPDFDEVGAADQVLIWDSQTELSQNDSSTGARRQFPEAVLTWLRDHQLRYFSSNMEGGVSRLIKHACRSSFAMLQPGLAQHYFKTASQAELVQSLPYLLAHDRHLLRQTLTAQMQSGAALPDSLAYELQTSVRDFIRNNLAYMALAGRDKRATVVANFLRGSADLFADIVPRIELPADELKKKLQSIFDHSPDACHHSSPLLRELAQFLTSDTGRPQLHRIIDQKFPLIDAAKAMAMWSKLDDAEQTDLILAQRTLLIPVLRHYADVASLDPACQAAARILSVETQRPSQQADRYIAALRAFRSTPHASLHAFVDQTLPELLERTDATNRVRIATRWLRLCPHSTAAVAAFFAAPVCKADIGQVATELAYAATTCTLPVLHIYIAQHHIEAQRYLQARTALLVAAGNSPTIEQRNTILQMCGQFPEDDETCIAPLDAIAASYSDDAFWTCEANVVRGQQALKNGNFELAQDYASVALAIAPEHPLANEIAGQAAIKARDYSLAESHLLSAAQTRHSALWMLAHCYQEQHSYSAALDTYLKYKDKCPNDTNVLIKLAELYAVIDPLQAIEYLEELQKQHPKDIALSRRLLGLLVDVGNRHNAAALAERTYAAAWHLFSADPSSVFFEATIDFFSNNRSMAKRAIMQHSENFQVSRSFQDFAGVVATLEALLQSIHDYETKELEWCQTMFLTTLRAIPSRPEWATASVSEIDTLVSALMNVLSSNFPNRDDVREAIEPTLVLAANIFKKSTDSNRSATTIVLEWLASELAESNTPAVQNLSRDCFNVALGLFSDEAQFSISLLKKRQEHLSNLLSNRIDAATRDGARRLFHYENLHTTLVDLRRVAAQLMEHSSALFLAKARASKQPLAAEQLEDLKAIRNFNKMLSYLQLAALDRQFVTADKAAEVVPNFGPVVLNRLYVDTLAALIEYENDALLLELLETFPRDIDTRPPLTAEEKLSQDDPSGRRLPLLATVAATVARPGSPLAHHLQTHFNDYPTHIRFAQMQTLIMTLTPPYLSAAKSSELMAKLCVKWVAAGFVFATRKQFGKVGGFEKAPLFSVFEQCIKDGANLDMAAVIRAIETHKTDANRRELTLMMSDLRDLIPQKKKT